MTELQNKFAQIQTEMNDEFIERTEEITGCVTAILARQHMLMIGVAGTAKSLLTDNLCNRIEGANYFQWLLTKFSTPEEVFGPVSLRALENDRYTRITKNKLPEADIVFLDEIFKSNSAILNALLTLINERKFHNNGKPITVPLQSMFGASNELPESEELGALYDRIMFRYDVKYIAEDSDFMKMLKITTGSAPQTTITLDELGEAQQEVDAVIIPDTIMELLVQIRSELRNEGVIASDRRYKQSLSAIRSHAWLNGRDRATEDDVEILKHILWSQPAEIKTVERTVLGTTNPIMRKITELLDQAEEIQKEAQDTIKEDENSKSKFGPEANIKLRRIKEQFEEIKKELASHGRNTEKVVEAQEKVQTINKWVLSELLGLDI